MVIRIISQTTKEREDETEELFNDIKPLLDEGYLLNKAVAEVKNINHHSFQQRKWYKELKELVINKGYEV